MQVASRFSRICPSVSANPLRSQSARSSALLETQGAARDCVTMRRARKREGPRPKETQLPELSREEGPPLLLLLMGGR